MKTFAAQVLLDGNNRPLIVFARGRTLYHAVGVTDSAIKLVRLDTLRDLRPLMRAGENYSPKRAASRWLNHDFREITPRARAVLRGLVARSPRADQLQEIVTP